MRLVSHGAMLMLVWAVLTGRPAQAQEASEDETSEDETSSSGEVDAAEVRLRETRARSLYNAGSAAVQGGDFESAYRYFLEANELAPRSRMLFNIGQAAERLRLDQEALDAFRQYLADLPEAPNRLYVEGRIRALEQVIADGETTAGETTAGETTDEVNEGPSTAVTGWLLFAGGLAVATAGGVMLGIGVAKRGSVNDAQRGADWSDHQSNHDLANSLTPIGIALLGVGVAVAAVGLVIQLRADDEPGVTAIRLGPGSLMLEGRL